jgi:hypothetical protein
MTQEMERSDVMLGFRKLRDDLSNLVVQAQLPLLNQEKSGGRNKYLRDGCNKNTDVRPVTRTGIVGENVRRERRLDFGGCKSRPESEHAIAFETGKAALALNPKPAFGLTSAANPILLPEAKPRAMREHFVVPSICSSDVACAEWSNIGRFEHLLQLLNLVNDAFNVHSVPISDMSVAFVKRSGSRAVPHFEFAIHANSNAEASRNALRP